MPAYDLSGMVVLVTGATDGLGRTVATDIARSGATVLVHGRSEQRIAETVADLRAPASEGRVRSYRADLASLAEVAGLADAVLAREGRLDVLVNNAGIGGRVPGGGARMESEDGYELRLAVNYLAGFLLTHRLLGLLRASAPARIVTVSSAGQMAIDFDDVMLERAYDPMRAYMQSKLAQVMFTFDLAEELDGAGVTATCLHPATFMPTKMVSASPIATLEEGADATMRLIADPALEGVSGRYFDGQAEQRADDQAYDEGARRRLRELSERLVAVAG